MKRLICALFFTIFFLLNGTVSAAGTDSIFGLWWNQEKSAQIEIYPLGNLYFGKIVYLKEPVYPQDDTQGMAGRTKIDRNNPDLLKRNRPLLGLQILDSFKKTGDRLWEDGHIYDPKNGKTYRCKITLEGADTLSVRGFIGISLLGRTDTWTRVK
jgi:uncharacterized protein (DUF2147 family)